MNAFPEKSDGVVRIRPFTEEHLTETYVGWLNDPEVVRYSEQRHRTHTLESARAYYDEQNESINSVIAIEALEEQPVHIGNMRAFVNEANNFASLSIVLGDKAYWGTGAASRAWNMALDALLDELGFRLVIAATMELNKPMIKLMERSGMVIDAVLPKRFLWEGQEVGMLWASKPSTVNGPRRS